MSGKRGQTANWEKAGELRHGGSETALRKGEQGQGWGADPDLFPSCRDTPQASHSP